MRGVAQFFGIIVFCFIPSGIFGLEKQWLFYNTWNDKANWDPPRIPCEKDHIKILDGTVFIGTNSTISSEITLPTNGEMVFANDAEVVIGASSLSQNDGLCQTTGQDIAFIGQPTRKWLKPTNWQFTTDGKVDDYLTKAAPFVERIPCKSDSVTFKINAFKVHLSEPFVVKKLTLGQQTIPDDNLLQSYLKTSEGDGRLTFSSSSPLLTLDSNQTCPKEGCVCGHENIREKICSTFKCPSICKRKVLPFGDCCYHCGALLEFKFVPGFDLNFCWHAVREQSRKYENGSSVYVYMSRITEEKIQILLTDEKDGKSAEDSLLILKSYLENLQKSPYCGAYDIVSTFWYNTTKLPDKQTGDSSRAKVAGIIISCIAVVIVLFIVVVAWLKRRRDEPSVKFENTLPGIEDVEYATTDFMEHYHIPGASFDNPTYNAMFGNNAPGGGIDVVDEKSPKFDIPVNFIPHSRKLDVEQNRSMDNSFENPVYDVIGDESPKDAPVSNPVDTSVQNNPLYSIYAQKEKNDLPTDAIDRSKSENELYADDETDSVASLKATLKLELKMEEEQDASMEDSRSHSVELDPDENDTQQNGIESTA